MFLQRTDVRQFSIISTICASGSSTDGHSFFHFNSLRIIVLPHNDVCDAPGSLSFQKAHRIWTFIGTRIASKTKGSAKVFHIFPVGIRAAVVAWSWVRCAYIISKYVTGKFYNSHLHSKADARVQDLELLAYCAQGSFLRARFESPGNQFRLQNEGSDPGFSHWALQSLPRWYQPLHGKRSRHASVLPQHSSMHHEAVAYLPTNSRIFVSTQGAWRFSTINAYSL